MKLVLPVASKLLAETGSLVCLVKPQFEAGREQVGKKGIVRDKKVHRQVIENVIQYAEESGFFIAGLTFSPVTGAKGNIEYLLFLTKMALDKSVPVNEETVDNIVNASHEELE